MSSFIKVRKKSRKNQQTKRFFLDFVRTLIRLQLLYPVMRFLLKTTDFLFTDRLLETVFLFFFLFFANFCRLCLNMAVPLCCKVQQEHVKNN